MSAVVVEQTIPFDAAALDLDNSTRWNALLPLVRPGIKLVRTTKGPSILVDEVLAGDKSPRVHIAAVNTPGNFSSTVLDGPKQQQRRGGVTAIVTAQMGAGVLTAEDIRHAMQSKHGVVVVRAGKRRRVDVLSPELVEVETDGALEQDHVLNLLVGATETTRASIHHSAELLKAFAKGASTAHSTFHSEKADGNPAVFHVDGPAGFEKAKHAVERDLKHVMKSQTMEAGDLTLSVHFADVNGLSRLENYILAKEIADHLEASKFRYRLSHSTILNHKSLPRGFSISICPIPSHYLAAQPTPKPHHQDKSSDAALEEALSPGKAKMSFDDETVRRRIQAGCEAVIAEEPTITEYDTIVGDGDCGYTLRDGAKQVLQFVEGKDLSRLPETVAALVHELEINMGGTSGALYCIYLTALAGALATEESVPKALQAALQQLLKYTRARLGDRTMMDALIPFVDELVSSGNANQALAKAKEGVEGTKKMEAKLGRSTYLDESATQGVPDPGAYGLFILLSGMADSS